MKKLVAMIAALMMMVVGFNAFAAGVGTKEEAMKIALDYAGLKAEQVTFTKVHQDLDDGRYVYEIEFVCNGIEYDMNVDIQTGRVFDTDRDFFDGYDRYDHDVDWDDLFDFD